MRYEILRQGVVINTIIAENDAWVAAHHQEWRRVQEPSAPSAPEQRHISRLALKRRWPRTKWRAMLAAQAGDETVMDFKDSLTWATFIDLDDAELQAGLTVLTQTPTPAAYRLTTTEVDAILNAPIADNERV